MNKLNWPCLCKTGQPNGLINVFYTECFKVTFIEMGYCNMQYVKYYSSTPGQRKTCSRFRLSQSLVASGLYMLAHMMVSPKDIL